MPVEGDDADNLQPGLGICGHEIGHHPCPVQFAQQQDAAARLHGPAQPRRPDMLEELPPQHAHHQQRGDRQRHVDGQEDGHRPAHHLLRRQQPGGDHPYEPTAGEQADRERQRVRERQEAPALPIGTHDEQYGQVHADEQGHEPGFHERPGHGQVGQDQPRKQEAAEHDQRIQRQDDGQPDRAETRRAPRREGAGCRVQPQKHGGGWRLNDAFGPVQPG